MSASGRPNPSRRGWRTLGLFWVVVLAMLGAGAGVLQLLGPPGRTTQARPGASRHGIAPAPPRPTAAGAGKPAGGGAATPGANNRGAATAGAKVPGVASAGTPGQATAAAGAPTGHPPAVPGEPGPLPGPLPGTASTAAAGTASPPASPPAGASGPGPGAGPGPAATARVPPIAAPLALLQTQIPGMPGRFLPRIAPDGQAPMTAYAARFDPTDPHPRVGLILAGIGLDRAASLAAIRRLPAGVTLAVSPYAPHFAPLLAAARASGHEYLLSLPMEPQGFPLNDPGPHALMTDQTRAQNRAALVWAESRFAGYVGATGALGILRGERFAGSAEDMDPVLHDLAARGLLYIDPRPGAAPLPFAWGSSVDVVIDATARAGAMRAALARLDRIAARRGHALGLVGAVRPVAVAALAAWVNRLPAQGLILAPVTALVHAPPKPAPGAAR